MPWTPDLFSASAIARLEQRHRRELASVPFFDGLLAEEIDALVASFVDEPELHTPVRGRIKGERAFRAYVAETKAWLAEHNASVEDVAHVTGERRGFEEVVLQLERGSGRVGLPVAIVADRRSGGLLDELRIYYSNWPLTGRHLNRPPLLQPDPELRPPDIVAEFGRALAAGELESILATCEEDARLREPAGDPDFYEGRAGLRAFYEPLFSNGGIPLEPCSWSSTSALVRWSTTSSAGAGWATPPQAAMGVFVRGANSRLAAVRLYDDVDRPLAERPPC